MNLQFLTSLSRRRTHTEGSCSSRRFSLETPRRRETMPERVTRRRGGNARRKYKTMHVYEERRRYVACDASSVSKTMRGKPTVKSVQHGSRDNTQEEAMPRLT